MKKGVYLFSVALLGAALCPSFVFADEAPKVEVPQVTTEFVESPVNNEPELTETAKPAEQPSATAEVSATPEADDTTKEAEPQSVGEAVPETVPEAPQESAPSGGAEEQNVEPVETPQTDPAAEEPAPQSTETSPKSDSVQPASQAAAPEAVPETRAARAASTPLKDDNDGKIIDHGKTNTDEGAKITSEYNFMPNFNDLEGIEVKGTTKYTETISQFRFDLVSAAPNTITVTYKNVGTYNGKVIDMKVTVKDWTVFAGSEYSNTLTIYKRNGIAMDGIKDVRLNYAFIDHLTGVAIPLSGFFNFTDIDLRQSIDIFDNNNVQNFYVTKDNVLYYKVHNGYIKIGDTSGINSSVSDMNHWLTYTYKNISNFDVRYNQDYETGAVFTYSYQAPVVIEEKPPVDPPEPDDPKEPVKPQEPKDDVVTPAKEKPTAPTKAVPAKVTVKEKAQLVQLVEQKPVFIATKLADTMAKPKTVAEAKKIVQDQQATLPQTNEKKASIFTTLGGAGLVFLSGLFIVKRKKEQ